MMHLIARSERRHAPLELAGEPRRGPLTRMRREAGALRERAQLRARDEIDRRRTAAATTFETLAEALRPRDAVPAGKARRTALAIAGGSGLALTAALGIGVAVGMVVSARRKKRLETHGTPTGEEVPAIPAALAHEPVV